jgi:hypothetical protein
MGTWDAGTEGKPKSPNIRKINLNLAVARTDVPIIREQLSYGENGAGAYPVNLKKGYFKEDQLPGRLEFKNFPYDSSSSNWKRRGTYQVP